MENPYNPPPNIRIFIMTTTRITRPRRLFVDALSQKEKMTFSELKDILVGKWEHKMDLTTLYRVIEIFKKQGLIHEIDHKNEKVLFFSGENFHSGKNSSEIIICENCGHIETKYDLLPANTLEQNIVTRLKDCEHCE